MNIIPFGAQILVKPVVKEQVLVSDDGTLNEYGVVVAIGSEVNTIKVGQKIGFSVFGVEKLMIDDEKEGVQEKFYFIKESDEFLLCVIED